MPDAAPAPSPSDRPAAALPEGLELRDLGPDDKARALKLDTWAFPSETAPQDQADWALPLAWDRTVGVVRSDDADGELAAMHSSYPFEHFPVPGGAARVAGVTWVAVHPGFRRRGILRAMIAEHFARSLAAGEAVSALTAAEYAIYGRFGYGKAADDLRLTIPRGAALRPVEGSERLTARFEVADAARHADLVEDLHRRAGNDVGGTGLNRPGWVGRETPELRAMLWEDLPAQRGGREQRRIVIVEQDGDPRGYATFRRKVSWGATGPGGTVSAGEVVALDAPAAHALWSTLLDLDLTSDVEPFLIPTDDVIASLLVDPRAANRRLYDNVWIRVLDVPAALTGRRYAADVDVVLELTDALLPANAGRWHLRATAFSGDVTCERTDAAADVTLDVRELGAAYLGGGDGLASAAAAGLVTGHAPGAVARLDAALRWPVAPMSSWIF